MFFLQRPTLPCTSVWVSPDSSASTTSSSRRPLASQSAAGSSLRSLGCASERGWGWCRWPLGRTVYGEHPEWRVLGQCFRPTTLSYSRDHAFLDIVFTCQGSSLRFAGLLCLAECIFHCLNRVSCHRFGWNCQSV